VFEARNPKSEIRKKAEARNPNDKNRSSAHLRSCTPDAASGDSDFGFRPSDFGFRISRPAKGLRISLGSAERAVALVITLIMLSVITFMAIAFLVLTRGERSSVGTATDQSIARLAADNALERVQAELIAPMIVSGNASSFGLTVSTNYISQIGFQGNFANQSILTSVTNVAYNYPTGGPLNQKDMLQNLTNLLISPRPPVFIVTNRNTGASDFRYYLDLNRNGIFEPSGWVRVTNGIGQPALDANNNPLFTYVQGDPQWIGGLEFPDRRHSPNNRFLYRYAYLVVPVIEGLDINYIHNAARRPEKSAIDQNGGDYFRNQGVGTWEINLASFLYDLNTNTFAWGGRYVYRPDLGQISGNAFVDACSILTRRYGGADYPNRLDSVKNLFFNGPRAFADHSLDGYTAGPLMTTAHGYSYNPDATPTVRSPLPWPGSDNTNHFFSTQDLFDPAKTSPNFAARLFATSTNVDTYNRYTFSRLLAQLGTDSAPEAPGKINLNYDNMVQRNNQGVVSETNFFAWRPIDFFTNAATMLLTNAGFKLSLTNLQVYPTNFYTPSVHRLLQLAANIYDSATPTNRALAVTPQYPYFPSVFRPLFRRIGTNIVIAGYREVNNANMANARLAPLMIELDSTNPPVNSFPVLGAPFDPNDKNEPMVSGIPLIIGAKKGFPNFNELAMQTKIFVTRLLEFRRSVASGPVTQTNQMYVVGITNSFAVEAWNSYLTNYPLDLQLVTTVSMTATMTNELGVNNVLLNSRVALGTNMNIAANSWKGWASGTGRYSMMLPFGQADNFFFLNNATYKPSPPHFETLTHEFDKFANGAFYVPHWWLNLNTRLLFILVDTRANRIVDYVNIDNWEQTVDINAKLAEGSAQFSGDQNDYKNPANQWLTNRVGSISANAPTRGIINQIQVGLNGAPDLQSFSQDPYAGLDKESAVDGFRFNLVGASPIYPKDIGKVFFKSNVFYAPFDPYRPIYIHTSWQANDPLVHYTAGDLKDLSVNPTNRVNFIPENPPLQNIGEINTRYRPWGGNPQNNDPLTDQQVAVKDPYVTRSDDWDFPTNKYPNIGWLGRVHRGTPWQTVFLKSTNAMQIGGRLDAGLQNWSKWTGNPVTIANPALSNLVSPSMFTALSKMIDPNSNGTNLNIIVPDTIFTSPTNDWHILDLFTTAVNENAGRGRLSINQTNLAAWSGVLSGVSVLPNVSATNPPTFIQPAGVDPRLLTLVNGINNVRTNFPNHAFSRLGEILATPELSVASPYLLSTNAAQVINDEVVERIPQQILGLLHGPEQPPRFVVYSYGQALKPAGPRSFFTGSGGYFGLCTNYQITAEVATRAVVRVEGAPSKPRTIVETFNVLPPD